MNHNALVDIALVLLLGIAAQWAAWRLGFPSILLLLLIGIVAGPVAGLIDADALLGDLLPPVTSLLVALILFEGGLSLDLRDIREARDVVRRLISVGALVSFVVIAGAAWLLLGLDIELAILFGALLSVTGPTVIGPLLRQVRPRGVVGPILQWEGILIDPIGAMLAVLVFEAIVAGGIVAATTATLATFFTIVVAGSAVGALSAGALVAVMRRFLIPDYLQNAATTALVIGAFTLSDTLASESGLLAVTVMGVMLANQRRVPIHHIIEFKENIRVLVLALLFILLASRLELDELLALLDVRALAFLGVLVLVARPASVWISSIRSRLSWKERAFIMGIAPRGIVAAAVSSIFALELEAAGVPGADLLVPYTFATIIATVVVYGIIARPLARALDLASPQPNGVLIVGAQPWVVELAAALDAAGVTVLVVDTNWANVVAARRRGLATHFGSILDEEVDNDLDLGGIGMLLAVTPNDAVNSLACIQFRHVFGAEHVFQLRAVAGATEAGGPPGGKRGRELFAAELTAAELERRVDTGWRIELEEGGAWLESDSVVPLVVLRANGSVAPIVAADPRGFGPRDRVIALAPAGD
jgi:NhaP-type Na+/H+ or K+/H+ antiporter